MVDDQTLRNIYRQAKIIAVVGLSPDPDRPSFQVASYLKEHGFRVIPVNPKCELVLGEKCCADLTVVQELLGEEKIDIVDIFRRPELVLPHVVEAIAMSIKTVWMQEGIAHLDAAKLAEAAGITVIMNRCIMKEHKRLFGGQ